MQDGMLFPKRSSEVFVEKADGIPAPSIKKTEWKFGRIIVENEFWESAMVKVRMLSGKK